MMMILLTPKCSPNSNDDYAHPILMMILFTQKSSPNDDDDFAHPNLMMIMLTPAAKAAKSTAFPPEMIEVEEALVQDCTLS